MSQGQNYILEPFGFYSLAPGARLDIGPGGKPYESLGACCAGCAKASLGEVATDAALMRAGQSQSPAAPSMLPYIAAAGVGLIGLVVYLRRRNRR